MNKELERINHYLSNKFYILIGNDRLHAPYYGSIAYVTVYAGEGAYNNGILET